MISYSISIAGPTSTLPQWSGLCVGHDTIKICDHVLRIVALQTAVRAAFVFGSNTWLYTFEPWGLTWGFSPKHESTESTAHPSRQPFSGTWISRHQPQHDQFMISQYFYDRGRQRPGSLRCSCDTHAYKGICRWLD